MCPLRPRVCGPRSRGSPFPSPEVVRDHASPGGGVDPGPAVEWGAGLPATAGGSLWGRRRDFPTHFRRRRGSPFDEFFSDFFDRPFGAEPGARPSARFSAPPPRRRVEQVDITEFFSDATRELLQRAAQQALEWGSLDLDTDHLLWGAMQDDLVAQLVRHADGDPDAIAAQVADEAEKGGRTDVAPSLSPEAKAALLRAYDEMRELNSSYLGP